MKAQSHQPFLQSLGKGHDSFNPPSVRFRSRSFLVSTSNGRLMFLFLDSVLEMSPITLLFFKLMNGKRLSDFFYSQDELPIRHYLLPSVHRPRPRLRP